ncbi:putative n-sulfoglucosamine sulfohydrolase [Phaeomoniella chlamydospora]|uniref:Putative n-sulfoglucosamine sulfohydrolase n=1 Tax=Phaeomoniella chlamydospora TaxID=158046 RepID=A0A0G2EDY3_PHACM|nr:putative n-sulfoglucosamine sulfohydrolase [Phaeomoniella chlamydospora]
MSDKKPRKKNILLLIADDLGKNLGCYGETSISTPNIDALASQGVLFTHAFTSTASCSNSRSVIYTGLHTHQSGQYGLAGKAHHFVIFDHVKTSPALFRELGYLTGLIGKIHVGPASSYPWEVNQESITRDVAWVADNAGAFFEKAKEQDRSFFLTVGYIDPHRDMTRSGFGNKDKFDSRIESVVYKPEDIIVPQYINNIDESRFEFSEYFQSISRLDQGIGLILRKLQDADLEDDTLLIFLSDNGPPFLNSKTTLYDAGVRLPFIVRHPEVRTGITNPNMVSYVDIFPTFLEWANATEYLPNGLPGQSILPILPRTDLIPDSEWKNHVYGSHTFHEVTNYWPTRFLRTRNYKYHRNVAWRLDFPFAADLYGSLTWEGIRNSQPKGKEHEVMVGPRKVKDYFFRPPEELYDLENDPQEIRNLAKDPSYRDVLLGLRKRLEDWQMDTADPWLYRDGVSVKFIKHHLDAGMKVPDRFDLDLDNLRSM